MLPESGLREVTELYIYNNRFAGTIPDEGMFRRARSLALEHNYFEGSVQTAPGNRDAKYYENVISRDQAHKSSVLSK
eukprot:3664179-Amphidinium_carterae.1